MSELFVDSPVPVASVVPLLPLEQAFTYRVPDHLDADVVPGVVVLVPFGPRTISGVVVSRSEETGTFKPILSLLDDEPVLNGELLELTRWMASYYVCSWGEVLRAAIPTGLERSSRTVYFTNVENSAELEFADWYAWLADNQGSTHLAMERGTGSRIKISELRKYLENGWIDTRQEVKKSTARILTAQHVKLKLLEGESVGVAMERILSNVSGDKQRAVLKSIAEFHKERQPDPSRKQVQEAANASASTVQSLVKKGVIEILEKEVIRTPFGDWEDTGEKEPDRIFHPSQKEARERIREGIASSLFKTFLLHGVTGSGKTEVYIASLKDVLARGKSGIILVPEIALTPQTVKRFRSHFGDRVAVLHSRMSTGERFDAWRQLRDGRYDVAIGPRSAILAPMQNLGIIIVDEEHEGSYKQFDPAPRYHARDVAVMRASMNNAVCILGSATPSLESYVNAERGKYTLLRMPDRVPVKDHKAAPLPDVSVIDLRLEHRKHQLKGVLSDELREAIRSRLDKKEQVILLQNRRGYAPVIECKACGWAPECTACAVTMTYHKKGRRLHCHYCGASRRVPTSCEQCGSVELEQLGVGTQKVEEELLSLYPDSRVIRIDVDTTRKKNAHHKILSAFGRGEADILVGTQMVAKGLDFGNVTLVGVVNADTGMLLPDFRASERTFQLLTQVAGRAGRSDLRGAVILQTRNVEHPAIVHARTHDFLGFLEFELPQRRLLGYPPFGRMAAIEFRGNRETEVARLANGWTACLKRYSAGLEVLGPQAGFISRIKRLYRFHTIIRAKEGTAVGHVQRVLRQAQHAYGKPSKESRVIVDIDPIGVF